MSKPTMATVWLDGCSGCHMSFLDIDDRIIALAKQADLVYSPLVDNKIYPDHVDLAIVEGAVSTNEDEAKIRKIREHTGTLIALGDCAVTGNVPAMRNPFGAEPTLERAYVENVQTQPGIPREGLPVLREIVVPIHEIVDVDVFVPGCPPPADAIYFVLTELLAGRQPNAMQLTRFGK